MEFKYEGCFQDKTILPVNGYFTITLIELYTIGPFSDSPKSIVFHGEMDFKGM